jgi:hypothetical protein
MDATADMRERLRSGLLRMRENAALLAGEIARDLPNFTVHDITHLDALWSLADLIGGPGLTFNAAEGFVFGAAVLIHDLGMAVAACPGGIDELRADPAWNDTIAAELMARYGTTPTAEEIQAATPELDRLAMQTVLRRRHARQAAQIAMASWTSPSSGTRYLLDDSDLRSFYAPVIGTIAASHGMPLNDAVGVLPMTVSAPGWLPAGWTVDAVKIACALRLADAAHLDEKRAPQLLAAMRVPVDVARSHWYFQGYLGRPQLAGERLVYSSTQAFTIEEADAWWVAHDALKMVDGELRSVDALLADTSRSRFAARGVAGVEDPVRLSRLIPVSGWAPVAAEIRVGDVAAIVARLGGSQLYGNQLIVPLRELIQNAADAVRARRKLERRDDSWGHIMLRTGHDENGFWVEVEDNGIGMSVSTLVGPLLDFGASYWASPQMQSDWPGLLASGFAPTGKYGIGFFSAFMWGPKVRVTSRRCVSAQADTNVLEFQEGLSRRPLLRPAQISERLLEGGTRVRVWIASTLEELLAVYRRDPSMSIAEIIAWLCPTLDVRIIHELGHSSKIAIEPGDWLTLSNISFLERIWGVRAPLAATVNGDFFDTVASTIRELRDDAGRALGRAAVLNAFQLPRPLLERAISGSEMGIGVVTVGGFRACSLTNIAGVLMGVATRAARDAARPIVDGSPLWSWASDQARITPIGFDPDGRREDANTWKKMRAAQVVVALGGSPDPLPIARAKEGLLNERELEDWARERTEIYIVGVGTFDLYSDEIDISSGVLVCEAGRPGILQSPSHQDDFTWPDRKRLAKFLGYSDGFPAAISSSLLTSIGRILPVLARSWQIPVDDFPFVTGYIEQMNLRSLPTTLVGRSRSGVGMHERAYRLRRA